MVSLGMGVEKSPQKFIVGCGLRLRKVMAAPREGMQTGARDLAGNDLAQLARHQHVVVGRDYQGWRANLAKAVAGVMGKQGIDPRQYDIRRRWSGGLQGRRLRRQPGRQRQCQTQVLVGAGAHLAQHAGAEFEQSAKSRIRPRPGAAKHERRDPIRMRGGNHLCNGPARGVPNQMHPADFQMI